MKLQLRKIVTFQEEIFIEGEKNATIPLKLFGVAAVVKNPWSGRGFVDDLKPEIKAFGPILGKELTNRIIELAGGGDISIPITILNGQNEGPCFWINGGIHGD